MLDSFSALIAWEPENPVGTLAAHLTNTTCARTRVVEFTSLTDGETTGTDDQDFFHIWLFQPGQDLARDPPREL